MYNERGEAFCSFYVMFLEVPVVCTAFICNLKFVNENEKRFSPIIQKLLQLEEHQIRERNKVAASLATEIKKYITEYN